MPYQDLTPREEEVLTLVVAGMSNKQIARALGIVLDTVKHHVSAILRKLDVGNRAAASAAFVRSQVVARTTTPPRKCHSGHKACALVLLAAGSSAQMSALPSTLVRGYRACKPRQERVADPLSLDDGSSDHQGYKNIVFGWGYSEAELRSVAENLE